MKLNLLDHAKWLPFLVVAMLSTSFLLAQRTISGVITDEQTGEPLIGANVLIPGTSTGTSTGFDGDYTLTLPEGTTEIMVSYTGYASLTIDLSAQPSNVINVTLSSGEILDEVVVIGYGTVKKDDVTGAVQTVSTKDFNKGAINTPQELLNGKVAGVQITQGAAPGDGAAIRIRGGSSLSASNDPLIVIDGLIVDNGGIAGSRNVLNILNPNDIESFTVLKDASATAIYGSRASNGVILITTKKGSLGSTIKVDYSANVSYSTVTDEVDVYSADEYRALINEQFPEGHPSRDLLGDANTNWQDEIYQGAFGQDHNISLSGGIAGVLPYRFSLGYTNRDGVLKTDNFERTTLGLNLSPGFLDNTLQVKASVKAMFTANQFTDGGAIGSAVSFDPTQPVRDAESVFGGYYTWLDGATGNPNSLAQANPLALLELRDNQSNVNRVLANVGIDYRFPFLPSLRANLNVGLDYSNGSGTNDVPTTAAFAFNGITGGGVDNEYEQEKSNELIEFYLNYVEDFGKHNVDIMGGYSWQRFFFDNFARNSDVAGSEQETQIFIDKGELFLASLFGRFNYSYDNRFLATFTLRGDATSRFPSNNRWGVFPSGALAYKVIDNGSGVLNRLKVRVGAGTTGQQDVGSYYQGQPRYTLGQVTASYPIGGEQVTTIRPEAYNEDIKWESTITYNAGVDFGLFNDRLSGSLEVYQRPTFDLLNFVPVPAGTNLSNFLVVNVGDLTNTGVEFSLNTIPIQREDLTWNVGFNVTYNENEIEKLTLSDDPNYIGVQTGGISGAIGNTIQINSVGFPAQSYYVYEQVYDESGVPVEGLYVDRNGDGIVSPDDLYRTENPAPDVFFGFNTSVDWKQWTFSLSGRGNIGNTIYNNVVSAGANVNSLYNSTNFLSNSHRALNQLGFQNPQFLSDHFLEDGSFFRLDFINVAYRLEDLFNTKNRVTISAQVQNPVVFTSYDGLDPEIFGGIDSNLYPRARTYVFGLNVSF
ncbi:MAG: TonB-dependent receptor [Bacteroidota bacterium]